MQKNFANWAMQNGEINIDMVKDGIVKPRFQ